MRTSDPGSNRIRVGVSACLVGAQVRFDGGHKRDRRVAETLARHFELVTVCPEVEVGMGTPRETVRLVSDRERPRLVTSRSAVDWTERMESYATARVTRADLADLRGFILKSDSPSCGLERVRVYGASGVPTRDGVGVFARALLDRFPLLPVEEEGRLNDARLRESFVTRVFGYHRVRAHFADPDWTLGALVRFHARHKYLLLAHSPRLAGELGKLVAGAARLERDAVASEYTALFMAALAEMPTTGRHANVLLHIVGHLHDRISAAERHDLLEVIDDYRHERIPLAVPVTLLRHHVATRDVPYVRDQLFFAPHPKDLGLRNHVA
ncbi:MAG: DUF523 and DUF1722 domain-containing protein [bacterium]